MSHTIVKTRTRNPMWVYEHNYVSLVRLAPSLLDDVEHLTLLGAASQTLSVSIIERCRYTLGMKLSYSVCPQHALVPDVRMELRLYQDASLLEVIAYQGHRRFLANYPYPNAEMLHPDEKRQANLLLHDLLSHFRSCDYRAPDPMDVSSA
ncbi:MAG TPA: DUF1249 domain-containing protein [Gammaproteobacteria bacterium]|nr:DUF1249 domain-containing protein [Gammaproteobacteria bacterium]